MFKKKLVALGLTLAMIGSMVACGKDDSSSKTDSNSNAAITPAGDNGAAVGQKPVKELASGIADHSKVDAGSIVNFEDGNMSFLTKNDTDWAGDKGTEISVAEKFGSKVLMLTRPNGAVPAFAIDVNGLLGDKAGDCASISVDIGIDPAGDFAACGGMISVYAGETSKKIEQRFNIIKPEQAFKTYKIDLGDEKLVPGAKNYLAITGVEDTAAKPSNIYIDNIIFLDKDGKELPVNTKVEFAVNGVGVYDWSNAVKQPTDEKLLLTGINTGVNNNCWWPENANSLNTTNKDNKDIKYWDLTTDTFGKGDVLTIYYAVTADDFAEKGSVWSYQPYIICQNWKEDGVDDDGSGFYGGGWEAGYHKGTLEGKDEFIKAADTVTDDNTYGENVPINKSFSICQYSYEYLEAAAKYAGGGEDFLKYSDFLGIAACCNMDIIAVTIGKAAQ